MWGKSERAKSTPGSSSSSDSSAHPGASMQPHASSAPATVNQRIKIKGEVSGQGDFFVDGELEGKVRISDGTFTVGPNARVTAEIEAQQIVVAGEVVGSLKAHERIQVLSTGKVTGEIDTRGIVIEDGAVLHGQVATPRAAVRELAVGDIPPEDAESEGDQAAPTPRPESSKRAKGAAAAGSPSYPNPEKH